MKVHVCCFCRFVPEPEADHRATNAMMKKVHRCGVSTDMRGDSLTSKRRAGLCSTMGVLGEEMLNRVTTKSVSPDAGKERICRLTCSFA